MGKNKTIKYRFSCTEIVYVLFFLFLCGCTAHKRGYGFDAMFCRLTFVAMMAVQIYKSLQIGKIKLYSSFLWLMFFVAYYMVSGLWSSNLSDTYSKTIMFNFVQILGAIFVIEDNFSSQEDYKKLFKFILWSIIYMVILLVVRTPLKMWGSERVGEVISVNANTVGVRTATAVLLCMYYSKQNKFYCILAIGLALVSMLSGSRKAFIILLVEIIVFFLAKARGWKVVWNVILTAALVYIFLYAVFKIELFYNVLGKRIERGIRSILGLKIVSANGVIIKDKSYIERVFYRDTAIKLFLEKPILGWGGNGFRAYIRRIGYSHVAYSHCNYTELLATLGIVGFCLYYVFFFRNLIVGIKSYYNCSDVFLLITVLIIFTNLIIQYYVVSYYDVINMIIMIGSVDYIKRIYRIKVRSEI